MAAAERKLGSRLRLSVKLPMFAASAGGCAWPGLADATDAAVVVAAEAVAVADAAGFVAAAFFIVVGVLLTPVAAALVRPPLALVDPCPAALGSLFCGAMGVWIPEETVSADRRLVEGLMMLEVAGIGNLTGRHDCGEDDSATNAGTQLYADTYADSNAHAHAHKTDLCLCGQVRAHS